MMTNSERNSVSVLVVIVNYFSANLVVNLVKQFNAQELSNHINLSIVCAENSVSKHQQESLELLELTSKIPFKLRINDHNLGFGRAINSCAKNEKFDFLCCINPDVTLLDRALITLLNHCQNFPNQGVWGGLTVDDQHKPDFRHAWQEPSLKNTFAWAFGLRHLDLEPSWRDDYRYLGKNNLTPYSVDCVSGCYIVVSQEVWHSTRGFDSDFFLYSEEVDLCRRSRELGFQPTIVPESRVKHVHHSTLESIRRIEMIYSSKLLYASKHHGFSYKLCYQILIFFGSIIRVVKHLTRWNLNAVKVWGNLALTAILYHPRKSR